MLSMTIKRSAFTLIELLSVIAVIGVLAAILIPVVGKVRKSSYDATCTSNLRQVSAAYLLMMSDNNNILIPAIEGGGNSTHLSSKWYKQLEEGGNARAWNIPLASFMPGSNLQESNAPKYWPHSARSQINENLVLLTVLIILSARPMEVMEPSEAPCAWSSCPLPAKQSCLVILIKKVLEQ